MAQTAQTAQAARPAPAPASAQANAAANTTANTTVNGVASTREMERAQRAAESPLRAILEAAKVRRRVEPDAAPDPAGTARRAGVPPRAGGNGVDTELATAIVTIRTLSADPLPQESARSAPLDATAIAPIATVVPPVTRAELASVPALPSAPVPANVPASGAAASSPTPQVTDAPRLLHMVEPEVGPRLLEQLPRPEVTVELTLRTDGSVSSVQVQPPVPRQMVSLLVAALEQWRFAPLPAPRQHRVQLVFNTRQ